jgi:hypothetical protein
LTIPSACGATYEMSIATSRVHPLVPFDPICSPVHARASWQRPVVEPFAARMPHRH